MHPRCRYPAYTSISPNKSQTHGERADLSGNSRAEASTVCTARPGIGAIGVAGRPQKRDVGFCRVTLAVLLYFTWGEVV